MNSLHTNIIICIVHEPICLSYVEFDRNTQRYNDFGLPFDPLFIFLIAVYERLFTPFLLLYKYKHTHTHTILVNTWQHQLSRMTKSKSNFLLFDFTTKLMVLRPISNCWHFRLFEIFFFLHCIVYVARLYHAFQCLCDYMPNRFLLHILCT